MANGTEIAIDVPVIVPVTSAGRLWLFAERNLYDVMSFVVSSAIGLDTNTSSSDYIQLHAGDKATLAESLAYVQQTASEILKAILPKDPAVNLQP